VDSTIILIASVEVFYGRGKFCGGSRYGLEFVTWVVRQGISDLIGGTRLVFDSIVILLEGFNPSNLLFRVVWLGIKVSEGLVVSLDCEVLSVKVMSPGMNEVDDSE
jgi:hypothetical protein